MNNQNYNPFVTAQKQFDHAADLLELNTATRELLRNPIREFHFTIPITMDDGSKKIFRGFRVQHNDARGPAKGGIRFHPNVNLDEVKAALRPETRLVYVETPTNPMMEIADLQAVAALCREHSLISVCDNTFMSPYLQRPLAQGFDIGQVGAQVKIGASEKPKCT